jgi:hypothetical protein
MAAEIATVPATALTAPSRPASGEDTPPSDAAGDFAQPKKEANRRPGKADKTDEQMPRLRAAFDV